MADFKQSIDKIHLQLNSRRTNITNSDDDWVLPQRGAASMMVWDSHHHRGSTLWDTLLHGKWSSPPNGLMDIEQCETTAHMSERVCRDSGLQFFFLELVTHRLCKRLPRALRTVFLHVFLASSSDAPSEISVPVFPQLSPHVTNNTSTESHFRFREPSSVSRWRAASRAVSGFWFSYLSHFGSHLSPQTCKCWSRTVRIGWFYEWISETNLAIDL